MSKVDSIDTDVQIDTEIEIDDHNHITDSKPVKNELPLDNNDHPNHPNHTEPGDFDTSSQNTSNVIENDTNDINKSSFNGDSNSNPKSNPPEDPESQFQLANELLQDQSVPFSDVYDLFMSAANKSHVGAHLELGKFALNGIETGTGLAGNPRIDEAISHLTFAAEHNVAESMYYLGHIYSQPQFLDEALSCKWFEKICAPESGFAFELVMEAKIVLGRLYLYGGETLDPVSQELYVSLLPNFCKSFQNFSVLQFTEDQNPQDLQTIQSVKTLSDLQRQVDIKTGFSDDTLNYSNSKQVISRLLDLLAIFPPLLKNGKSLEDILGPINPDSIVDHFQMLRIQINEYASSLSDGETYYDSDSSYPDAEHEYPNNFSTLKSPSPPISQIIDHKPIGPQRLPVSHTKEYKTTHKTIKYATYGHLARFYNRNGKVNGKKKSFISLYNQFEHEHDPHSPRKSDQTLNGKPLKAKSSVTYLSTSNSSSSAYNRRRRRIIEKRHKMKSFKHLKLNKDPVASGESFKATPMPIKAKHESDKKLDEVLTMLVEDIPPHFLQTILSQFQLPAMKKMLPPVLLKLRRDIGLEVAPEVLDWFITQLPDSPQNFAHKNTLELSDEEYSDEDSSTDSDDADLEGTLTSVSGPKSGPIPNPVESGSSNPNSLSPEDEEVSAILETGRHMKPRHSPPTPITKHLTTDPYDEEPDGSSSDDDLEPSPSLSKQPPKHTTKPPQPSQTQLKQEYRDYQPEALDTFPMPSKSESLAFNSLENEHQASSKSSLKSILWTGAMIGIATLSGLVLWSFLPKSKSISKFSPSGDRMGKN